MNEFGRFTIGLPDELEKYTKLLVDGNFPVTFPKDHVELVR